MNRKKATGSRVMLPVADSINQIWSLDFASDALFDGRRFRVLSIVDYNGVRPHSSLGYRTLKEFAAARQVQRQGVSTASKRMANRL